MICSVEKIFQTFFNNLVLGKLLVLVLINFILETDFFYLNFLYIFQILINYLKNQTLFIEYFIFFSNFLIIFIQISLSFRTILPLNVNYITGIF